MRLGSPPLFWRTFLLIVLLSVASLAAWVPSIRVFEREPRARQIAQQVVSIVNTTRSALVYSDPARRRGLLADLAENEGIRVVPLEPTDQVVPLPEGALTERVTQLVDERLGPGTRLASEVNGVNGLWISFSIEGDGYWVFIDRDLLSRRTNREWITWAVLSALGSLLVAIAIARVVNRPLAALSGAARELGAGRAPAPLPDKGPREIRAVNQSFNRMVANLEQLEQDRSILLAGISHDLRTPLTRLRLELELNGLPEAARDAMSGDLDQMDSIVRQFLDYARPAPQRKAEAVDLSALVADALGRSRLTDAPDTAVTSRIEPGVAVRGHPIELARAIDNLLGNADRFGRDDAGRLALELRLEREAAAGVAVLTVSDRGRGIAPDQIDRLLRPFERGDSARSGAAGAGLGLSIVDRVARLHGGRLALEASPAGGLRASLRIPALQATAAASA
ncbi:MAG TPA: ATP-binding protein [Burkholderiaceae bacterium]